MSLQQPRTRPPEDVIDEHSRFSKTTAFDCPICGESGIDIWITEGATSAAGVCITNDHESIREDEIRALYEERSQ